jgi:hypothetical protein
MTQICQVVKPTAQKLKNTNISEDNELQAWDMTKSSHNNGGGQRTPNTSTITLTEWNTYESYMSWVWTCTYNEDKKHASEANYLNFFHVHNLPENTTRN